MSQLPVHKLAPRPSWFRNLVERFTWAVTAFRAPRYEPVIKLADGIALDLHTKQIVIDGDFGVYATGNVTFRAEKHVIIESGRDDDPQRPGYRHSIWFNPDYDGFGRPVPEEQHLIMREADNG